MTKLKPNDSCWNLITAAETTRAVMRGAIHVILSYHQSKRSAIMWETVQLILSFWFWFIHKDWCGFRTDPTDYVISLQGLVQFQDRSNWLCHQSTRTGAVSGQIQLYYQSAKTDAVSGQIQLTMSSVYKDWCSFRTDPTMSSVYKDWCSFRTDPTMLSVCKDWCSFRTDPTMLSVCKDWCSFRTDPTMLSVYKDNAVLGHIQLTMSSAYKEPNDSAMSLAVGGCYCRRSDQAYSVMVSLLSVMKQYVLAPYFSALKQKSRPESRWREKV